MSFVGVIAEYDPFHLGHLHHLREAKERSGLDTAVVVMSACFTQRGEAALLPPLCRARMALQNGADVVIALPALWSLRDAEHFALGGVHLLSQLGAGAISFGCETDNLPRLQALATMMEDPSPMMLAAIHSRLDAGLSYPAALSGALHLILPDCAPLLDTPNNTLAVCYLRAIERLGAQMRPIPVKREGDYHAAALSNAMPSATAVRSAVYRGDWEAARGAMPESAYALLRQAADAGQLMRPDALDQALLYRLRTMDEDAWHALPGLSEGIEDRLRHAARSATTRQALLESAKTRRYPWSRLSRLCAHALLGIDLDMVEQTPLPPAAWLLGFRQSAAPLLGEMKRRGFPLIGKSADYDRSQSWFQVETRAYDLWCLGAGLPAGLAFRQGVAKE